MPQNRRAHAEFADPQNGGRVLVDGSRRGSLSRLRELQSLHQRLLSLTPQFRLRGTAGAAGLGVACNSLAFVFEVG